MALPSTSGVFLRKPLSAAHRIYIGGELEALHGHDFEVTALFASENDPTELEPALTQVLTSLAHSDLVAVRSSEGGEPSAERLARAIYTRLAALSAPVVRVTVEEAPGSTASFELSLTNGDRARLPITAEPY